MADEPRLNELQKEFITWNSERLGVSLETAEQRFLTSQAAFADGHRGAKFRRFCGSSYKAFLPFYSDEQGELEESYKFFSLLHFLRMLSYGYRSWPHTDEIVQQLSNKKFVNIIDYGCGLAQGSFWFANELRAVDVNVSLTLVDFPTLRKDFLTWKCKKDGIALTFIDANGHGPAPTLPKSNLCIATEFFEHVRNPIQYFAIIDEALEPGSWILTNVADHRDEFMHVSPELSDLRDYIEAQGYEHLVENRVMQKPAPT